MTGKPHPLPHQLLWEARQLAATHHLFVVEVQDVVDHQLVTAYVLYRQAVGGAPTQRICKHRDPADMLRAVKTVAGVTA